MELSTIALENGSSVQTDTPKIAAYLFYRPGDDDFSLKTIWGFHTQSSYFTGDSYDSMIEELGEKCKTYGVTSASQVSLLGEVRLAPHTSKNGFEPLNEGQIAQVSSGLDKYFKTGKVDTKTLTDWDGIDGILEFDDDRYHSIVDPDDDL